MKGDESFKAVERKKDDNDKMLAEELRAIIIEESQKPESEMDTDLIKECVDFVMELEGFEGLTHEQLEEKKQKLKQISLREVTKPKKKKISFRVLLVAVCTIFLMMSISIYTTARDYIPGYDLMHEIAEEYIAADIGEFVNYKGISFRNAGSTTVYETVEEFMENEDYNILYPTKYPEGVELDDILISSALESDYSLSFMFEEVLFSTHTKYVSFTANPNPNAPRHFLNYENANVEVINSITCYISDMPCFYQCEFVHDGVTYTLTSPEYDHIVEIVNGLKPTK